MNWPNMSAFATPSAWSRPVSSPPSAASATLTTTLSPRRSCEAVEFATLTWVDWFNNRRLLEPIGNIPPAEAEERYYAMIEELVMAA